jgi:hypothetical protein
MVWRVAAIIPGSSPWQSMKHRDTHLGFAKNGKLAEKLPLSLNFENRVGIPGSISRTEPAKMSRPVAIYTKRIEKSVAFPVCSPFKLGNLDDARLSPMPA